MSLIYRERCERRKSERSSTPESVWCTRCSRWLDASSFSRSPVTLSGRSNVCKDCAYSWKLTKVYGITLAQYNEMLVDQNYCCSICAEPQRDSKRLAVDHDHDTGRVRGLLCHECNLMLGKARDNPDLLRAGATYLEGFDD